MQVNKAYIKLAIHHNILFPENVSAKYNRNE